MSKRLEILLIIAFATALVALLVFDTLDRPSGELTPPKISSRTAPTESVDNAVNEFLEDVALEADLSAEVDGDGSLLTHDREEVNALSQTYAETEF